MRIVNNTRSPKYCSLVSCDVKPGRMSRDITILSDFLENIMSGLGSLTIRLSEKDRNLIRRLEELSDSVTDKDLESNPRREDPTGILRLRAASAEKSRIAHEEYTRRVHEATESKRDDIRVNETERHDDQAPVEIHGTPSSLKDIMSHNSAIISRSLAHSK